jgi:transcriptional regulator with XRE-family HTH domain
MTHEFARMIDRRVARRIRERRLHVGMTQNELARILGVAFQQAHKYEHGISRVSAGRLYHIATALGAPVEYFFAPDEPSEARRTEAGDDG